MTRRFILGNYGTGVVGLKAALPGFDAILDDDTDPAKFSFNSQWAQDVMQIHAAGKTRFCTKVTHSLGFAPFAEFGFRDNANDAIAHMTKYFDSTVGLTFSYTVAALLVTATYVWPTWVLQARTAGQTQGQIDTVIGTYSAKFNVAQCNYMIWNKQAW